MFPLVSANSDEGHVQIVEKKGDVAIWGPLDELATDRRRPRIICYGVRPPPTLRRYPGYDMADGQIYLFISTFI